MSEHRQDQLSAGIQAAYAEAKKFIEDNNRFLLSTHVNPDGDGIGSILALRWLLTRLGKESVMAIESIPPPMFDFLDGYADIRRTGGAGQGGRFSAAIIADSPNLERVGDCASLLSEKPEILTIDHHVSSSPFGTANLLDSASASSTQVIYGLIKLFGLNIDSNVAEALYTGLSIDTGRFRFSNTTEREFRMAADMVAAGARPDYIATKLYYSVTLERQKGLAKMLGNIKKHESGKIAHSYIDYEYISGPEGKLMDTEGFVNQVLSIKGVEVAILMLEPEKKFHRVSLRSKNGLVDVNEVAGLFNGGGHARASGCRISGEREEVLNRLIAEIVKRMPEQVPPD